MTSPWEQRSPGMRGCDVGVRGLQHVGNSGNTGTSGSRTRNPVFDVIVSPIGLYRQDFMAQAVCELLQPLAYTAEGGIIHVNVKAVERDEPPGTLSQLQHTMHGIHPAREKGYCTRARRCCSFFARKYRHT